MLILILRHPVVLEPPKVSVIAVVPLTPLGLRLRKERPRRRRTKRSNRTRLQATIVGNGTAVAPLRERPREMRRRLLALDRVAYRDISTSASGWRGIATIAVAREALTIVMFRLASGLSSV